MNPQRIQLSRRKEWRKPENRMVGTSHPSWERSLPPLLWTTRRAMRAAQRLVLAREQEVLPQLIFSQRGRVALEKIGQAAHVTDLFLPGGRLEVFEFAKLPELCDGRAIGIHEDRGCPQPP